MAKANDRTKRIAELNDQFRKDPTMHGKTYVTRGVETCGPEFIARAMAAVAAFDHFPGENDPYGHHDFGVFKLNGEKLFWKIDYYSGDDPDLGSEDPSDRTKTERVLTIMMAEEH